MSNWKQPQQNTKLNRIMPFEPIDTTKISRQEPEPINWHSKPEE